MAVLQQRKLINIFLFFTGFVILFILVYIAYSYDFFTSEIQQEAQESQHVEQQEMKSGEEMTTDMATTTITTETVTTSTNITSTTLAKLGSDAPSAENIDPCSREVFADEFVCLLNAYRAAQGKQEVHLSAALSASAYAHSTWMSDEGSIGHIGKYGSTFSERCELEGVSCAAENVARGFTDAESLLGLWQQSSSHNENLLGDFTLIGVGVEDAYATIVFAY